MSRDFQRLTRGPGVFVPRWAIGGVVALALLLVGLRLLVPPSRVVQRLDSPDGRRIALLERTRHTREHFTVRVKDGAAWYTLLTSPPLTNDFRVDLQERLSWSTNSERLYFRWQGQTIWGYDFSQSRALRAAEL